MPLVTVSRAWNAQPSKGDSEWPIPKRCLPSSGPGYSAAFWNAPDTVATGHRQKLIGCERVPRRLAHRTAGSRSALFDCIRCGSRLFLRQPKIAILHRSLGGLGRALRHRRSFLHAACSSASIPGYPLSVLLGNDVDRSSDSHFLSWPAHRGHGAMGKLIINSLLFCTAVVLRLPLYVGILKKKYSAKKKKIRSGDHAARNGGSCPMPPIASVSAESAQ